MAGSATDGRILLRRDVLSRLSTKPNPSKGYMTRTLSELRIQLASILNGPADIDSLLRDDGNSVDLGFAVRVLFEDEWDGKKFFTFGRRMRSV